MDLKISDNRIYVENEDGKMIAEIDFPEVRPGVVNIVHTEVDKCLEGQGIAGKLTQAAADEIRRTGRKAELSCSYAIKWFAKHEDMQDLLDDPEEEAKKAALLAGPACGINRRP